MASDAFTIGIEEEYQLVEIGSGALRARAPELLADDWSGAAKEEYQRTMLEVNTSISRTAIAAGEAIRQRRQQMAELAGRKGLAIAAAGVHPVGVFPASQLSEEPRYWRLAARGGVVARELHIFGMHVHVAVPDREAAVRAMRGMSGYIPALLVLSASSPFHRQQDTDFDSFRTVLRDMFPRAGPPLPVNSAAEYDELVRILEQDNGIEAPVVWDVRPSAAYPTLEFRFFDVCPWLDVAVALAACARALTAMFADLPPHPATGTELMLLKENRWRAARYGLDAQFIEMHPATGAERGARATIRGLLDRVGPVAERLGDGPALAAIERVLEHGNAATAMREVYAREGTFSAVSQWVAEQTLSDGLGTLPKAA
jgi:glutamate---cysteine ligase / carboxylate-amine ligase